MKPIILIAVGVLQLVLVSSCAPRLVDQGWKFAEEAPAVSQQRTEVTVSLVPDPIMEYEKMCRQLEAASWEQGLEELLHRYVSQATLLRLTEDGASDGGRENTHDTGTTKAEPKADQKPECEPWLDSVTGMVFQRTAFFSTLIAERSLGGVIAALQEDQSMGGMLSRAYVSLWGPAQGNGPIPVLIVRHSSGLEPGMVQIIGSGMITQLTERTSQMRILESTREIFPGDLFFQLQVRAEVLRMEGDLLPLAPEMQDY